MSFKVKFSPKFSAVQKRIKNLPDIALETVNAVYKKDVVSFVTEFINGLDARNFNLEPLKEVTVKQKKYLKYKKPRTELVGKGKQEPRSYVNMFQIRQKNNNGGWVVSPREDAVHHSGLEFKKLLYIHEYGATIEYVHPKSGKPVIIRIPPRPAMRKAFNRFLRRTRKEDTSKAIKKAIAEAMKFGKSKSLEQIKQQDTYNAYDY